VTSVWRAQYVDFAFLAKISPRYID